MNQYFDIGEKVIYQIKQSYAKLFCLIKKIYSRFWRGDKPINFGKLETVSNSFIFLNFLTMAYSVSLFFILRSSTTFFLLCSNANSSAYFFHVTKFKYSVSHHLNSSPGMMHCWHNNFLFTCFFLNTGEWDDISKEIRWA